MSLPINAANVEQAAKILENVVINTPLQRSARLTQEVGQPVYLKREDLQRCRSFKVRGAYTLMSCLGAAERQAGVVAASAGNHAQGVAYSCASLQIKGQIFLPSTTPRQKRHRIATIGGDWVEQTIVDGNFDQANTLAQQAAADTGRIYVNPYDDPQVMAGQGTIGSELFAQVAAADMDHVDTLLVPVGGGGLIAGILTWVKANHPNVRVVGVESEGAACVKAAFKAGRPVSLSEVDSFVDGTAVGRVGGQTWQVIEALVDDMVTVPEGAVCTEMLELYHNEGIIAEPAGALASAAAKNYLPQIPNGPVVCLISGGNNDLSRYAEVLERSGQHEGLRHYFLVTFPQEPGALRFFLNEVLTAGEDIIHFGYTKKTNRHTGPALVGLELASAADIKGLRRRMAASPLKVQEISPNSDLFKYLI